MKKILYVGAGSDIRPLLHFPLSKFVYIDSLPRNQHGFPYYYKGFYRQTFKKDVIKKIEDSGLIQSSGETVFSNNFEEILVPDLDSHVIEFGHRLSYFFSTSIPHEDYKIYEKIKEYINICDTLLICGHHPDKEVLEMLKKPFHIIGYNGTYFPKDREDDENSNMNYLFDSETISGYTFVNGEDKYECKTYSEFYKIYREYREYKNNI